MYERIRRWFSLGLWSAEMVCRALEKGVLTRDQTAEILGEEVGP